MLQARVIPFNVSGLFMKERISRGSHYFWSLIENAKVYNHYSESSSVFGITAIKKIYLPFCRKGKTYDILMTELGLVLNEDLVSLTAITCQENTSEKNLPQWIFHVLHTNCSQITSWN